MDGRERCTLIYLDIFVSLDEFVCGHLWVHLIVGDLCILEVWSCASELEPVVV